MQQTCTYNNNTRKIADGPNFHMVSIDASS